MSQSATELAHAWLAKAYLKIRSFDRCLDNLKRIEAQRRNASLAKAVGIRLSATGHATGAFVAIGSGAFCPNLHCLLKFTGKEDNLDLAELRARNLHHDGRHVDALRAIAPAIYRVESRVKEMRGGGQLWLLRTSGLTHV